MALHPASGAQDYIPDAEQRFNLAASVFVTPYTDRDLMELWVLADTYLIPSLQNLIMDVLCEVTKETLGWKKISSCDFPWIWKRTSEDPKESKLRLWVLRLCTLVEPERFKEWPQDFPLELLLDYAEFATGMTRNLKDLAGAIVESDYYVSLSRDGYS